MITRSIFTVVAVILLYSLFRFGYSPNSFDTAYQQQALTPEEKEMYKQYQEQQQQQQQQQKQEQQTQVQPGAVTTASLAPQVYTHPYADATPSKAATPKVASPKRPSLSLAERETLCKAKELEVYPEYEKRKVYDLFLVGSELDWLEIRLNELAPYVDYFVLVESSRTFTFHDKPLYFRENYHRFHKFAHKIIYRTLDFTGLEQNTTWEREHFQRNALFQSVFPSLLGKHAANWGDVLIVSDLDEIPRPETIEFLRSCEIPDRVTLRSRFYYYSFQWEHDGGDWWHPQATYFRGFEDTITPEGLRMTGTAIDLENAAWHCSSCFKTIAEMKQKIESFSHTEFNHAQFKDPKQLVNRVRHGKDLFDREGETYHRVSNNSDIPKYMREHKEQFAYLLDRDPENANFVDYLGDMDLNTPSTNGEDEEELFEAAKRLN